MTRIPSLVAGALSTIDMQDLAGYEGCTFEVHDRVDDIAHLAHPSDRMLFGEVFMRLWCVHRRLDRAGRNRVDADTLARVFDRKRLRCRVQATLRQGCQDHTAAAVFIEAGRSEERRVGKEWEC